mmetsp:Transcript_29700/g.78822  ORF Transcript_29700/g.78822 Transcript_29700/m.78822 type:complete len:296 (-) Transcript_29700:326-1213(-)
MSSGCLRYRSQIILGSTKKSSTSQSLHIEVKAGTKRCAARISVTKSHKALRSGVRWTYLIPTSQLSSQSTKRATNPALLHKCGSTRSKQSSTSLKYSRMAEKESTTSVARIRAAAMACAPAPSASASLTKRNASTASRSTSTRKSSRPLRRKFATEFSRAMQATSRSCCARYSSMSWNFSRNSRRRILRSCLIAWTTSRRAFSSISINSTIYLCSKLAHVKSNATSTSRSSDRCGLREVPFSAASSHRSSNALRSVHAYWSASARRMVSALNSNLSPLTHMTAYCSTLASSTSTR